ncbi:MAG: dihydrodipicolinate synthase family protein [Eubacteriales bacterium]|nr:dihydrodipicolinate synthase family protein [Eubacteriales bacterium]
MSKYDINKFRNITVALNTPFREDGSVDTEAVKAVSRYFRDKGVKQMYVCGSTGEGFLLDTEERMLVAETVVKEVGRDMNIIVHVGCPDTRHSCILAEHAEKIGAAATSAVPCVYYRPSEESVYRHWTEITKAADLPFFIYNIPQLTGFNLSMKLFYRMLENERVAGVKCSSDPAQDILRFKLAGGKDFIVFNGPDEQFVAGRILGADAGIGGTYGAMPELYMKMDELINRGEWDKAAQVQAIVTPLIYRLCSFASMHGAVKGIITLDGCPMGNPRLPFLPVSVDDPELIGLYKDIKQAIADTKDL